MDDHPDDTKETYTSYISSETLTKSIENIAKSPIAIDPNTNDSKVGLPGDVDEPSKLTYRGQMDKLT